MTRASLLSRWSVRAGLAGLIIVLVAVGAALRWWPTTRRPVALTRASSVVALPTKVAGPPDFQYLTDAVPGVISSYLAGVPGLDTKVPPSSIEVDKLNGDVQRVARAYRVQLCLLSSITVQGGRLLLVLQLQDPETQSLVWSQTYEGTSDGYLTLVRQAADGVRGVLRPASTPIVRPAGQTTNSSAELAFRQGLYYSNRFNNLHQVPEFDVALASFTRALELDPQLADAAAGIAWLQAFRLEAGAPASETVPQIENWARRALVIDPRCGQGFAALSAVGFYRPGMDRRKTLEFALRGAVLSPRVAIVHNSLSHTAIPATLALEAARESERLDPLYLYAGNAVAWFLFGLGRASEALTHVDGVLAIEPDFVFGLENRLLFLADLGRAEEAARILERIQHLVAAGRHPEMSAMIDQYAVFASRGDRVAAQETLKRLVKRCAEPTVSPYDFESVVFGVFGLLARQGNIDAAFTLLAQGDAHGYLPPYDVVMLNPNFDPIRRDPRFGPVAARARARLDEMLAILMEAEARGELPAYLHQPLADLRQKLGM